MTSVADAGSNVDSHSNGETMAAVRDMTDSEKDRPNAETIKASSQPDSENTELHQTSEPLNAPDEEFHRSEKLVDVRTDATIVNIDELHVRTEEVELAETDEIPQEETLCSIEKPLELPPEQHSIVESDNTTADEGRNSTVIDASDMNSDSAVECCGREGPLNSSEPESQAATSSIPEQMKHKEESTSSQAEVHPVTEEAEKDGDSSQADVHPVSEEAEKDGDSSQAEVHPVSEEAEKDGDAQDEEPQPLEVQSVEIPLHWHPKPCLHVSISGGSLTEEDKL